MAYSLNATAKIMAIKTEEGTNVCGGNTLTIPYVLAINKVANSIANPPDHLGGLDSSSQISNDSDVVSEKCRGVLYPDLGKSSRKKVFFPKEYLQKEKGGPPSPGYATE